jgi:hypothetical protein
VDTTLGIPLFGVQMYGNTGSSTVYHPFLIGSGASWLRVAVNWSNVEPISGPPGDMIWNVVDASLTAARSDMGRLNIVATIDYAPAWAVEIVGDTRGPIDSDDLDEFAEFVGALVERYDGDGFIDAPGSPIVNYWEFYNEPDAGDRSWTPSWGDYGSEYAQMLAIVYPSVKSANGNAKVVMGGIAYDWFYDQNGNFNRDFLDDVLQNGGGNYIDVINFHYYPAFKGNWLPPGSQGLGLLEKTQAVRDKFSAYGHGNKPVMITEAGWHSNSPPGAPGSPEIQARYVVELFVQSMAADVETMIWWMLHDPGGWAYEAGLVTNETIPVPKLAYEVYQTAVAELGTAHFERALTLAETGHPDMEAFKFNDNVYERTVYVAWMDPVGTSDVRPLDLAGTEATLRDFQGNVTSIIGDGGDGVVTVPVGGRPVYVEMGK